jgi:hypothetical protein
MFQIAYLPANQAWCVLWHGQQISIDCQSIFNSREELVSLLESKGLRVDGNIIAPYPSHAQLHGIR